MAGACNSTESEMEATSRSAPIIHVKTIAGEKKPLPPQQDVFNRPVAELVKAACHEIGNNYYNIIL
jgi:hypothetical protein